MPPGKVGRTALSEKDRRLKPTVLLADDDSRFLDLLRKLLEPEFRVVASVGDGQALIKATQVFAPDLIVTDISMPLIGGLQAVETLKTIQPGSRVLFLTMHEDPAFIAEARKLGASGYVFKHCVHSDLLTAAQEALEDGPFFASAIQE